MAGGPFLPGNICTSDMFYTEPHGSRELHWYEWLHWIKLKWLQWSKLNACTRGLYFGPKIIFIPFLLLKMNDIFLPLVTCRFSTSIMVLLPCFFPILHLFYPFTSPFLIFFPLSSFFFYIFPFFLFAFSYFSPKWHRLISPPRGRYFFQNIDPWAGLDIT